MKKFITNTLFSILNESNYLKLRFFYKHKKIPNLVAPKTFSEKLLVSKMDEITDYHTVCADKYSVRSVVKELVGEQYLIPLLGRYTSKDDFIRDFPSLPEQFALKAAHGSGWNEIIFDKSKIDFKSLINNIDTWLNDNYYHYGYEKQYKNIQPSIVVEKLLVCPDGKVPVDYKFYCFGKSGKGKIIVQVDIDRFGNHERLFYDENWNKSPIAILSSKSTLSQASLPKPIAFSEMLDVARKLSSNFNFSRVDLYEHNGDVYFGEITFHPESAYGMFVIPQSAELDLGRLI